MNEKKNKLYRANLVIVYPEGANIENYRHPLHEMMRNIAWLHQFEYAISEDHPFPDVFDSDGQLCPKRITDLVYFRSTDQTRILAKEFRKMISDIFHKSFLYPFEVDLFFQLQKFLSEFPFPNEYMRTLSYPFVEKGQYHKRE
jgi:hypothetical protein